MAIDYYRVLGVMPGADEVVIRAAYKALAQRYHPDRFGGNPNEANRRMAEINAAYDILGDPNKRAIYDRDLEANRTGDFAESDSADERDQAFQDALSGLDRRWLVACKIYPDLEQMKQELHRVSPSLSFWFVNTVLESKAFEERKEIAAKIENQFLQRYFGPDLRMLRFAKKLILSRNKKAARALNELVNVMGSNVSVDRLIRRIEADFNVREVEDEKATNDSARRWAEQRSRHIQVLRGWNSIESALKLARMEGYSVEVKSQGLWKKESYLLHKRGQNAALLEFSSEDEFIQWARDQFCR